MNMNQDKTLPPLPEKKQEPQVIYVERAESKKGKGCFGIGCGIFGFSFPLAVIILILGLLYLVFYRPVGLWTPFVNFLNDDLIVRQFDGKTYESAKVEVEKQVTKVGANEVFIDEDQLTALTRKKFPELPNLVAIIENNE